MNTPSIAHDRGVYRTRPHVHGEAASVEPIVEVRATWGDGETLAVAFLDAGERFVLAADGAAGDDPRRFVHPRMERGARTLVEHRGAICTLHLPRASTATLFSAAGSWTVVAEGDDTAVPLDAGVHARIVDGDVVFAVRRVPSAERLPPPRRDRLLGVGAALSLCLTAGLAVWTQHTDRDDDLLSRRAEVREEWLRAQGEVLLRARAYTPTHAFGEGPVEGGTGLRAPGEEGATGLRTAPDVARRWRQPPMRRVRAPENTATTSAQATLPSPFTSLAALGLPGEPGGAANVFQHMGNAATDAMQGAMYGDHTGDARGFAGLGLVGTGWGGGRAGDGLVGLGRITTRGHGTDDGTGQGMGGGSGACGCGDVGQMGYGTGHAVQGGTVCTLSHGGRIICTLPAQVAVGTYSSAEIRRVVLTNLGQVRRCHEQALVVNRHVEGRVTVRWEIDARGVVTSSTVTGDETGVPSLAACIADATQRWVFPEQYHAGGTVVVNYPFTLTVTDE